MTCLGCGAAGALTYGYCERCTAPVVDGGETEAARRRRVQRKADGQRARIRAKRMAGPALLSTLPESADLRGMEWRRVVDWVTGRVADVLVYPPDEAASVVEAAHLAACKAAGVWTPAVARAS